VRCPSCRKQQRLLWTDGQTLPENKQLRAVIDLVSEASKHECAVHKGSTMRYYCFECDARCCDQCALLGAHRGHEVDAISAKARHTEASLTAALTRAEAIEKRLCLEQRRISSVYHGLLSRVDTVADAAIEYIEGLRDECRKALCEQRGRSLGGSLERQLLSVRDAKDGVQEKVRRRAIRPDAPPRPPSPPRPQPAPPPRLAASVRVARSSPTSRGSIDTRR
jgi:hypothetical protein